MILELLILLIKVKLYLSTDDLVLAGARINIDFRIVPKLQVTIVSTEKLILDWRKRQQSRAAVRLAIEDILYDHLPNPYTPELCDQKRDDVYQHIYANYYGAGQSIYTAA